MYEYIYVCIYIYIHVGVYLCVYRYVFAWIVREWLFSHCSPSVRPLTGISFLLSGSTLNHPGSQSSANFFIFCSRRMRIMLVLTVLFLRRGKVSTGSLLFSDGQQ